MMQLQDSFGRQFTYLRLSITDVCNFRCSYCLPNGYQGKPAQAFLSVDEISRLASVFARLGTKKIRISGGEPSLRKDLPEIIARCATTQGIDNVSLTTNGFQLTNALRDWQQAGLTGVNVSIDSLQPALFKQITGHNKLASILEGIEQAVAMALPVKVNAVLMRSLAENSLKEFLAWLKHMPVTLRFIELMQTGDNNAFFRKQHMSGKVLQQQLLATGWQPLARQVTAGPAQEYSHPDYQGNIGLIMPYSKDFCLNCNRLRVSASGKLHLCLFAEQGHDIRHYLRSNDKAALVGELQRLVGKKDPSHWLQKGVTGATKQLAMLGG